jgi:hypothetical protein
MEIAGLTSHDLRKFSRAFCDAFGAPEQVAVGLVMVIVPGLAGHHTLCWL